jgi:integrase
MADTKHLEPRGKKWWFIRSIPKELRPIMREPHTGKANFRRNLNTSDLALAQLHRARVNAEFELEVAHAMKRQRGDVDAEFAERADALRHWGRSGEGDETDMLPILAQEDSERIAMDIEKEQGEAAAQRFYRRATGQIAGTEVDEHMERWIAENPAEPRTDMKRRKVIGDLAKWRSTLYVETFTKQMARAFVDEVLSPSHAVATINQSLGVLSTYWRWMDDQGLLKSEGVQNHWPRFRRKKEKLKKEEKERAPTKDEMKKLLHGGRNVRPELLDMMIMAALTGGRIEEIARVRVKDVNLRKMTIFLPGTKNPGADRHIPLHKQLKEIVQRRVKDKPGDAWLFDELPERGKGSKMGRATVITKAFTRHRRAVGVEGQLDGKRRSLVNFHSFRRWLTDRVREQTGISPDVVNAIFGWISPEMRERYGAGADLMEQMRTALDNVKLPK